MEEIPEKFKALAEYNARLDNGILHFMSYREKMAKLQAEFDEWRKPEEK